MIQVLCYTGRGFDTCWRPASVASAASQVRYQFGADALHTPIRFFTGDFA